jgi:uncharacterized repeat protein (TIGR01451 family)
VHSADETRRVFSTLVQETAMNAPRPRILLALLPLLALATHANAVEVTVKNDAVVGASTATIVTGFVAGEKAASWLTSPCNGNIRAVQVFWRSQNGTAANSIERSIEISRSATFPNPGAVQTTVSGPVMNDGVFNEFRFIDENNTVPINVPVTANETFVVAFEFDGAPPSGVGPSVARDTDGITASRNGLLALVGANYFWFDAATLGVTGDWVIRAVVDCPVVASNVDVSVSMSALPNAYLAGQALSYSIIVANAGPAAANATSIVDIFPAALNALSWTCSAAGGASCPSPSSGTGNITNQVNLPASASVTFNVSATVAPGTVGTLSNSATAVVASSVTDTMPGNNTRTLDLQPASLLIFANGFE